MSNLTARYLRPAEVELLIGDPTKAQQNLAGNHLLPSPN